MADPRGTLAKEIARTQSGEDRFLAVQGQNLQLDLAFPDRENGVRRIALREDDLPPAQLGPGLSGLDSGQERLRIEWRLCFAQHSKRSRKGCGSV
jgi:hypothetical protein